MSSPPNHLSPTVVPLYRMSGDQGTFAGTAFFINSTQILTALHVVHPDWKDSGYPSCSGSSGDRLWKVLYPWDVGTAKAISVRVHSVHPGRYDVVLIEIVEELRTAPEPVVWLQGIRESEWNDRVPSIPRFPVIGFPEEIAPKFADSIREGLRTERTLYSQPGPSFVAGQGLTYLGLAGGGKSRAGTSGGPVFWETSTGRYAIAIANLGGAGAASSDHLGEGAILPWLTDLKIPFSAVSLSEIRDDRLNDYIASLIERTRGLLKPVLGPWRDEAVGRPKINPGDEIREFFQLFVQLYARESSGAFPSAIRAEALEALYNLEVGDWKRFGRSLRPFKEAKNEVGDLSWRSWRLANHVAEVCALTEGSRWEKKELPAQSIAWAEWETRDFPALCRWVREQQEEGFQLLRRDHVWEALARCRHLILTSPAGGGKTTVALFLAVGLATPPVERQVPKLAALKSAAPELWRRLPILIRLRDYKKLSFYFDRPEDRTTEIQRILFAHCGPNPGGFVSQTWEKGDALLIFDGLDELETDAARENFGQCLEAWLTEKRKNNSILVTSRPTAYPPADHRSKGRKQWSLSGFSLWELDPLDATHQIEFLETWFRLRGPNSGTPKALAAEVRAEIVARRLEDLARSPILLVGLAFLAAERAAHQGNATRLPETRSEVFDQVVDLMLVRWQVRREGRTESDLEQSLRELGLRASDLRQILSQLALSSLRQKNRIGDFDRSRLEQTLKDRVSRRHPGEEAAKVSALVDGLANSSGLVRPVEFSESEVDLVHAFEFPIRPYRNYLAGEALFTALPSKASQEARLAFQKGPSVFTVFCVEQGLRPVLGLLPGDALDDIHANEALELALARQAQISGAEALIEALRQRILHRLDEGLPVFPLVKAAVTLALDVHAWTWNRQEGPVRFLVDRTWNLPEWRGHLLQGMHSEAETLPDRAAMGSLWGLLSPAPDFSYLPDFAWRKVGMEGCLGFIRGDELTNGGGGSSRCDLVESPFYMATYPVTVDQFEVFLRAVPSASRPSRYVTRHSLWRTPVFHTPNHPVVGVDWDAADAFCSWLTGELHGGKLAVPEEVAQNPNRWVVRLPEEWEWEFAARGDEYREPPRPSEGGSLFRVPWEWATSDEIKSSSNCENLIDWTTAVDQFAFTWKKRASENRSPYGIADMVGNVWEWCRTPWVTSDDGHYPEDYPERVRAEVLKKGVLRVVRGGGWSNAPAFCRCAYRHGDHPGARLNNLGFRLVLAPVLPGGAEP